MKRKEGFVSHTIGDKNYIVAVGDKSEQYNCDYMQWNSILFMGDFKGRL